MELILTIFVAAGLWRMYQKMGRQGWEGLIPIYNVYVMCEVLYGQGWKLLLFLIPLYNIYFAFRVGIDLSRGFHRGVGYGVGLVLLPVVFVPLTGFSNVVFGTGAGAVHSDDPISRTLDEISEKMQ